MLQSQNAATALGQNRIVRRQDRSQKVIPMQALDQIHNRDGIELVQIAGGFISEQHSRFGYERPRNSHALLLPPRQFSGSLPRPRSQPDFSQRFMGFPERFAIGGVTH